MAQNVTGNVGLAEDFHPNAEGLFTEIATAVGEEKLRHFLAIYGQGLTNNVISILDEGNFESERDKVTWGLFELDAEELTLGRRISGLHEDVMEFDQEIK